MSRPITSHHITSQCKREGYTLELEKQKNEGCRMHGFVEVAKVSGNFHIAPGKSFSAGSMHVHDMSMFGGQCTWRSVTWHDVAGRDWHRIGMDMQGLGHGMGGHGMGWGDLDMAWGNICH